MLILGLNYSSHDAAATLISDSNIIAACEEERFNRKKHSKEFPIHAIQCCINIARVRVKDIDRIAFFIDPHLHYKLGLHNLLQGFPKSILYLPYVFSLTLKKYRIKNILKEHLIPLRMPPLLYVNHHLAHAASAFYPSPFEKAVVLTYDGRGEFETICISIGRGTSLKKIYSVTFPHSIGYLYSMVTKYLGFTPQSDEHKVMGLSAYGTPTFCEAFSDIIFFDKRNKFKLNLEYFDHFYQYGKKRNGYSGKFIKKFGPPRLPNEPLSQRHADLAFALQRVTESTVLNLVKYAYEITQERNLCLAGGIALNCVANARILKESPFKKVFIQPAANDAGTSLGAALYCYHFFQEKGKRSGLQDIYLGPSFTKQEILTTISKFNSAIDSECFEDISKTGAQLIHNGYVIGWFQGRMEFGPRALGNRSIIAAPTDKKMKDLINTKVKFREDFQPFAPAILEEYMDDFFESTTTGQFVYPFMLSTIKVKHKVNEKIPAAVHIDGTARVQVVNKETNPLFWNLIMKYKNLSGIPVVLNTSFNLHGEPIVCSIEDAIQGFLHSGLDYLIIDNFLLKRK